jgi:hypothetical protein
MTRIGIPLLVAVAALTASAVLSLGVPIGANPLIASRAATFVGFKGRDTLFVERVRDVPGGFHGEVSLTGGTVWIRYRVELGPGEGIRRYELDMTPKGEEEEFGSLPWPMLIARRERDSVHIEPEPRTGIPARRVAVPPSAFMASTEMAVFEQAIRYGLRRGGARTEFPMVSAWTGQSMNGAVVRRGGNKVRLETGRDIWEFTLDREGRILRGTLIEVSQGGPLDPKQGIRVARLDPSGSEPLHRPLTIGESEEGRRRDRLDSLVQVWHRRDSAFRATLASGRPSHELVPEIDRHLLTFADRGGARQAMRCLEVVASFRARPDGVALAEGYARRAVAYADTHNVLWFGEQNMIEARMSSRMALAEILAGLGRRDSAIALLEAAKAVPREYDGVWLLRDVRIQLGNVLAAEGRTDDAIAALFEAVAVDTTRKGVAESLRRSLTDLWRRELPGDTTLETRIARTRALNWASVTTGGAFGRLDGDRAPAWSGVDLRGRRHSPRVNRPLMVVFWGDWSAQCRKMIRLAEAMHRRRAETGVDVVAFEFELPGAGPFSERIAHRAAQREGLTLPVLLDHDRETWTRFGGYGFPQVFLVDRRGRKVLTACGNLLSADSLSAWVAALGSDERR